MIEDFQERQRQQGTKMRSIMDYTMGIIFFCLGVFFIVYRHFGVQLMNREPSPLDYVIGGLFVVYGAWRFSRGQKKNYYR